MTGEVLLLALFALALLLLGVLLIELGMDPVVVTGILLLLCALSWTLPFGVHRVKTALTAQPGRHVRRPTRRAR